MEKIDVIIIRGAPGSGKSQTAKELAKHFPKGVRLEVDTVRNMVISVDWKNQKEHISMLEVSAGMVAHFLKLELSPVIVVDTFSGNKILKFLETLRRVNKDYVIKIFGLLISDQELQKRLEARSNDEFRDLQISQMLNLEIQKFKFSEEVQIDTTGLRPIDSATCIISHFTVIR